MRRKLCPMTAVHGEPPATDAGNGWTADDAEFGARLALVRHRMRWNIKEAATNCGFPPATWALWEAGSLPRKYTETCQRIADKTGADYTWLVMGSASAGRPNVRYDGGLVPSGRPALISGRTSHEGTGLVIGGISPMAPQRDDSSRPQSVIAPSRRRPISIRPDARPMSG